VTARSGLRRFVGEQSAPVAPPQPESVVEKCEMCGTVVGPRHGHVVDTEHRSILCACRACYLLFTRPTAGGGKYRAIPERYLTDPDHPITAMEWESLGIPVASAFFLGSESGLAAFYPSPAGATECLLDLNAWAELVDTHPLLGAAQPEVEAILIRGSEDAVECFLVPIDACYQLVGTVRVYWKGFDGGQEAAEHIEEFFGGIRSQARRFSSGA
jgi:uncharacterized protein DUF5947